MRNDALAAAMSLAFTAIDATLAEVGPLTERTAMSIAAHRDVIVSAVGAWPCLVSLFRREHNFFLVVGLNSTTWSPIHLGFLVRRIPHGEMIGCIPCF